MKKFLTLFLFLAATITARAQNPSPPTVNGQINAATTTATCANQGVQNGGAVNQSINGFTSTIGISVTGTWSATLNIQYSVDHGKTWTASGSTFATNQQTTIPTSGYSDVCVFASAYTSGTAIITFTTSAASAGGTVTSISATSPIVVTPNPITGTGTISCPTCGTGSGTIGGSIANTQIAFGTAANTIGGSANLIYNSATGLLTANLVSGSQNIFSSTRPDAPAGNLMQHEIFANGSQALAMSSTTGIGGNIGIDTTGDITLLPTSGVTRLQATGIVNSLVMQGVTGSAAIGVASAAGTPNQMNLPIATGGASQFLQTDGGSPQQLSWATPSTTATSVPFSGITSATNTTAAMVIGTGSSLSVSGTGTNNATDINGTHLASLATGILKNTTITGVPSIAVGSDLPNAIPIASVGNAGLSGTTPITISAAGAIACATCNTSAASITSNVLPKGSGGAQGLANSSITDDGTTISTAEKATLSAGNALSTSTLLMSGTPITGGSGTTNFPLFYLNSGAAVSSFGTAGTFIGINAPSGYTGNFMDFHNNGGASLWRVNSNGVNTLSGVTMATNSMVLVSQTAPTIAAAGCGGSAASITVNNGTAAFKIGVGTGPSSACTVTMPAATTGWNCSASDITTQSTSVSMQRQTGAESTTSVVITNFSDVTVPTAFVANDVLKVTCFAD